MRVTRSLRCIVLTLVGCAAHGPQARTLEPDEDLPARPTIAVEAPTIAEPPAPPAPPAPPEPPEPVAVAPEPSATDPYERGKQDAARAIAADELGLETFGYPAACRSDYARLLHARYRVRLHTVAGCVIDDEILEHARGYNEVMVKEIERRHGADALDRAARSAGCR